MKKLIFNCNQNNTSGLGHFKRCLNLARLMKCSKLFDITFIGEYSFFSIQLLKKYKFNFINSKQKNLLFISLSEYDIIVIDRYDIDQLFLNSLNNYEIKTVFIDDFNEFDFVNQDMVINFRVGVKGLKYKSRFNFIGHDYFIYNPELLETRLNYEFNNEVKKILFFATATNQIGHVFDSLPFRLHKKFKNISITYVTSTPSKRKASNFEELKFLSSIESKLLDSDLVINGGGLLKYEASFSSVPSATLSTNEEQHEDTKILEKEGIIYNLGLATKENIINVENKLIDLIQNTEQRRKIHTKCKVFFQPKSLNNLIEEIHGL